MTLKMQLSVTVCESRWEGGRKEDGAAFKQIETLCLKHDVVPMTENGSRSSAGGALWRS